MFCPNCGKDCADANFCSNCGTKLQQEVKNDTRKTPETTELVSEGIPCGLYKGIMSSIALYDTACVIVNKPGFFKKYETRIPYDLITSAIYYRSGVVHTLAYLLIRWEGNKREPIPEGKLINNDITTVVISEQEETLFYHIFYLLKAVAPRTAEFKIVAPTVDAEKLRMQVNSADLCSYYRQYAPHREKASEALHKTAGIRTKVAKDLINYIFDLKQKEIYDEDAAEAIRDLNRIVKEIQRQKEEKRAKEEREREQRLAMSYLEDIARE